jgi:zinc protease
MQRKLALFTAAPVLIAGALALAEEAKLPHRKWQDVPQPPLEKVADPKPVVATLKNGVKVFMLEDHELPTIDVTLIVHAGETDLPSLFPDAPEHPTARARQKAGLASIAGQVMRSGGTASKTGDELDEQLDAMAASVETSAGLDQAHVRMSCLKESFEPVLAAFADVLEHPAFREERVTLAKRQHMGALRRRNDNPAQLASREFARLIYGDVSPFGWSEEAATIDDISRDDLVAFYKAAFAHPETALLGAVGDFDAGKLKEKLDAAIGGWAGESAAAPTRVAVPVDGFTGPGARVYFARKTDVNQSTVILGHAAIQRKPGDPDYPAAVLANSILGGGGFAGRLMQHVRTEMGLAYGCSSRLDAALGHQGTFVLQGQTKSGSTIAMAKAMRKELERLVSEPPSAEDLRVHKQATLERLVFSFDSKSQILDRALRNEFYGFPQNELEVFQQGIAAVTADDVLRVAKKLFSPARLTTVVVGNDAEFDGKIEELGEVTPIEVKDGPRGGGRGRQRGGE